MAVLAIVDGVVVYEDGEELATLPSGAVLRETTAAPAGAIMNQLQGGNMGADLYNGALQ